ncbi:MFS transporter [Pseudomonas asplenii]|uniref:MFS transporter n=1 Tax=Pseudomonas asplenii TaxID=53407 RepID=UPI0004277801|nr:MFS transporter [Pseudomonas asplenii]UZE31387.1 MFS transporter [Pseudomonas asplenii]
MSILLFSFLFLALTADALMTFMVPVVVYLLTGSIEYSGLSYAVWWLPRLLLIPMIGQCIDNVGIRPLSIISDIIKTAGCLFLIFQNSADPLVISIMFGVVGSLVSIGNSQTLISYEKIIATLSRAREHHINLMSRMDFLAMVIGPVVGILLIDFGYKYLLIIPCLLYFLNAGYFSWVRLNPIKKVNSKNPGSVVGRQAVSSLGFIASVPVLLGVIFLSMGNNMFDGLIESSGAALVELNMNMPVKYFGVIDIVAGAFGVLGTYAYGATRIRMKRPRLLLMGLFFVVFPSLFLIAFPASFVIFVLCYAMSIFGKVVCGNVGRMIRIEVIPLHRLASTSSVIVMLNQSVLPIVGMSLFFWGKSTDVVYFLMMLSVMVTLASGCFLVRELSKAVGQPGRFPGDAPG